MAEIQSVAPPLAGGRYVLASELGSGGMATVYKAWDSMLEVERAVKILAPNLSANERIRTRFLNEARTLAKLRHPNIVAIQDVGEDGNRVYMVMELVTGGSLQDKLEKGGPLTPADASRVMQATLSGLGLAHAKGVIHRDIKPQNILLEDDGTPKLADFGIAQLSQEDKHLTRTGAVLGTWAYMAPEQRTNSKSVGPQSDIYSIAATLYALVTGKDPFDLYSSDLHDELFEGVHPQMADVIKRGTRYRSEQRFATCDEMIAALREVDPVFAGAAPAPAPSSSARPPSQPTYTPAPTTADVGVDSGALIASAAAQLGARMEPTPRPAPPLPPVPAEKLPDDRTGLTLDDRFEPPAEKKGFPAPLVGGAVALVAVLAGVTGFLLKGEDPAPPPPAPVVAEAPAKVEPPPTPAPTPPPVEVAPVEPAAPAEPAPVEKTPEKVEVKPKTPEVAPEEKPAAEAAPAGKGKLVINSRPWSSLSVDGSTKGKTAWAGELPSGTHKVVLETADGRSKSLSLKVPVNAELRFCWDFDLDAECKR